jgi:hypothetical protein
MFAAAGCGWCVLFAACVLWPHVRGGVCSLKLLAHISGLLTACTAAAAVDAVV